MIKTLFLVPIRDNAGRPFPPGAWRELDERLRAFGGYSRLSGVVGTWEAGGRVYRDVSRQYTVSLIGWRQFPEWLSVVEWVRRRFDQEAIYVEVNGVPEILG